MFFHTDVPFWRKELLKKPEKQHETAPRSASHEVNEHLLRQPREQPDTNRNNRPECRAEPLFSLMIFVRNYSPKHPKPSLPITFQFQGFAASPPTTPHPPCQQPISCSGNTAAEKVRVTHCPDKLLPLPWKPGKASWRQTRLRWVTTASPTVPSRAWEKYSRNKFLTKANRREEAAGERLMKSSHSKSLFMLECPLFIYLFSWQAEKESLAHPCCWSAFVCALLIWIKTVNAGKWQGVGQQPICAAEVLPSCTQRILIRLFLVLQALLCIN